MMVHESQRQILAKLQLEGLCGCGVDVPRDRPAYVNGGVIVEQYRRTESILCLIKDKNVSLPFYVLAHYQTEIPIPFPPSPKNRTSGRNPPLASSMDSKPRGELSNRFHYKPRSRMKTHQKNFHANFSSGTPIVSAGTKAVRIYPPPLAIKPGVTGTRDLFNN